VAAYGISHIGQSSGDPELNVVVEILVIALTVSTDEFLYFRTRTILDWSLAYLGIEIVVSKQFHAEFVHNRTLQSVGRNVIPLIRHSRGCLYLGRQARNSRRVDGPVKG
jgi:hypothetical protein